MPFFKKIAAKFNKIRSKNIEWDWEWDQPVEEIGFDEEIQSDEDQPSELTDEPEFSKENSSTSINQESPSNVSEEENLVSNNDWLTKFWPPVALLV